MVAAAESLFLSDAELQRIIAYIGRPVTPDFAVNRYPQDVPVLVRNVLAFRAREAELLRALRTLPLDEVTLEDGPIQIVEKAQAFWLEYQRGLWADRETARLKRAKDRAEDQVEAGKKREERLGERIVGLENAYGEAQQLIASLQGQIRELTDNLAAATGREAEHARRVRVLEQERAELEQRAALELRLAQEAHTASDEAWRDTAEHVASTLGAMRAKLMERTGG